MKKFVSILLALVLCFSLSVTAFAATATTATTQAAAIEKFYDRSDSAVGAVEVPKETLYFNVTPVAPTTANDPQISVVPLVVTGTMETQVLNINLPSYTEAGVYNYSITERAGNVQGVTYSDKAINVAVYVTYTADGSGLKADVVVTNGTLVNGVKVDKFTNAYDVGGLTVTKEVSGNLADTSAQFTIYATLTSDKPVLTNIYSDADGNNVAVAGMTATYAADGTASYAGGGWTEVDGKYTAKVTMTLSHGQTFNLYNIPAGVTYKVEEDAKHILVGDLDLNSATDEDYTVSYTGATGTIAKDTTAASKVMNEKNAEVPTGVTVDNAPYVVMLVAVAAIAVLFMIKRRNAEY